MKQPRAIRRHGARYAARIEAGQHFLERIAFTGRGLSKRTVDAVIEGGISQPERLLFMSEDDISRIPGIGLKGVSEVMAYKRRFMG